MAGRGLQSTCSKASLSHLLAISKVLYSGTRWYALRLTSKGRNPDIPGFSLAAVMGAHAMARILPLIFGTWPCSGWRGFNDGVFWFLVCKQLLPQEAQGLMIPQAHVCWVMAVCSIAVIYSKHSEVIPHTRSKVFGSGVLVLRCSVFHNLRS